MLSPLRKDLKRQRRFAAMLSKLFPYPASLWDLLTDETILCRCEELTVAEIRQVLAAGVHNPDNIKTLTRVGMGRCQGRMCGGALNRMIAMQRGLKVEHVGYLKPRPPVVPVPIERLLEEEEVSHVS